MAIAEGPIQTRPQEETAAAQEGQVQEGLDEEHRAREAVRAGDVQHGQHEEDRDGDAGPNGDRRGDPEHLPDGGIPPLAAVEPEGDVGRRIREQRQQGGGEVRRHGCGDVVDVEPHGEGDRDRDTRGDDVIREEVAAARDEAQDHRRASIASRDVRRPSAVPSVWPRIQRSRRRDRRRR